MQRIDQKGLVATNLLTQHFVRNLGRRGQSQLRRPKPQNHDHRQCLVRPKPLNKSTMPSFDHRIKRRKVRKGTQSCWECRRRKVRCIVSTSANNACDNCTRRKTSCISQEFFELPSPNILPGREQLETRLYRVETLIDRLSKSNSEQPGHSHHDFAPMLSVGCAPGVCRFPYHR